MSNTKHNHDRNGDDLAPGEPSAALSFGKLMPYGDCPRCDELRAGKEARPDFVINRAGSRDSSRPWRRW